MGMLFTICSVLHSFNKLFPTYVGNRELTRKDFLKCPYGFSRNNFSRKFDQWQIRRKKNSDSDLSFVSNSLLKSGTFGWRPRKQKPGNVKEGMKVT